MIRNRPRAVCFVGKGVYREFSGRNAVTWGAQEPGELPGIVEFVAPSSSGLVRIPIEEIVAIYSRLRMSTAGEIT